MISITQLLTQSIDARRQLFDPAHQTALRLFNGFSEGHPDLVIDVYGSTLVLHNYAEDVSHGMSLVNEAQDLLRQRLSWLRAGIVKTQWKNAVRETRAAAVW